MVSTILKKGKQLGHDKNTWCGAGNWSQVCVFSQFVKLCLSASQLPLLDLQFPISKRQGWWAVVSLWFLMVYDDKKREEEMKTYPLPSLHILLPSCPIDWTVSNFSNELCSPVPSLEHSPFQSHFLLDWWISMKPMNVSSHVIFTKNFPRPLGLGWESMLSPPIAFCTVREYISLYVLTH